MSQSHSRARPLSHTSLRLDHFSVQVTWRASRPSSRDLTEKPSRNAVSWKIIDTRSVVRALTVPAKHRLLSLLASFSHKLSAIKGPAWKAAFHIRPFAVGVTGVAAPDGGALDPGDFSPLLPLASLLARVQGFPIAWIRRGYRT